MVILECLARPPPPSTTENVCHCLFRIKWALLINLRLVSSCYPMSWSTMNFSCPPPFFFLALTEVHHSEKKLSLVISNTLFHAYYILTCFVLLLTGPKLAQIFHTLSCPWGPHPPTGERQTFISFFVQVYSSLLAKQILLPCQLGWPLWRRGNWKCFDDKSGRRRDGEAKRPSLPPWGLTEHCLSVTKYDKRKKKKQRILEVNGMQRD